MKWDWLRRILGWAVTHPDEIKDVVDTVKGDKSPKA